MGILQALPQIVEQLANLVGFHGFFLGLAHFVCPSQQPEDLLDLGGGKLVGAIESAPPVTDILGDRPSSREIVGDAGNPAAYASADSSYVYFRFRLDAAPLVSQTPVTYQPVFYGVEFCTARSICSYQFICGVDGVSNPDVVVFRQNTAVSLVNNPSDNAEASIATYSVSTHALVTAATSTFAGTPDYFLD